MRLFTHFNAALLCAGRPLPSLLSGGRPKSQDSAASPAMGKLRPGGPFNPARGAWQTLAVRMRGSVTNSSHSPP
ncbi:unnamed protein product [Staurois parvus]|uniref:Secreted protein n=1 Tax=Staurois parvus TaxID=386267 RepID=A0ABN9EC50_9NEOB|nr:unnamed protein product [Staurois parvus]